MTNCDSVLKTNFKEAANFMSQRKHQQLSIATMAFATGRFFLKLYYRKQKILI